MLNPELNLVRHPESFFEIYPKKSVILFNVINDNLDHTNGNQYIIESKFDDFIDDSSVEKVYISIWTMINNELSRDLIDNIVNILSGLLNCTSVFKNVKYYTFKLIFSNNGFSLNEIIDKFNIKLDLPKNYNFDIRVISARLVDIMIQNDNNQNDDNDVVVSLYFLAE